MGKPRILNPPFIMSSFKTSQLYSQIEEASAKHRHQQLNFRFKGEQMLQLLEHLPNPPELSRMVESVFAEALQKSDKRPMTEQLTLKQKYQKSHGLVFKDIPIHVQRHVIYDAILKLGRTMNMDNGQLAFPGACKMRSFFFPDAKNRSNRPEQTHRVCFPIFVNKRDQMYLYQWSQHQNGTIQLDVDVEGWDGTVAVELTRDASASDDDEDDIASSVKSQRSRINTAYQDTLALLTNMHVTPPYTPQPYINPLQLPYGYAPMMPSPLGTMPPQLDLTQQFINNSLSYPVSNISTSPTNGSESLETPEATSQE